MPRYAITEKAGRFVAGHRNTGVGTILYIPAVAAEYEITLGTLRAVEQPVAEVKAAAIEAAPAAEPEAEPIEADEPAPVEEPVAEDKPAAKKKKR